MDWFLTALHQKHFLNWFINGFRNDSDWILFIILRHPGESFGLEFSYSESELFQKLFSKQSKKRFVSCLMKTDRNFTWLNLIYSALIRMNTDQVFNPTKSQLGIIRIENSIWINPISDWKLGSYLFRLMHKIEAE